MFPNLGATRDQVWLIQGFATGTNGVRPTPEEPMASYMGTNDTHTGTNGVRLHGNKWRPSYREPRYDFR